jgi:8-oxo-dGTP pyrophosphatase MutT (NUDIX family)
LIEKITPVHRGKILELNIERVKLPNGAVADLEIAHHPGGAAVVAVDDQNRVCLLYQYRHAAGGWVWEIPAGKLDNKEPPINTAKRELVEEAGCTARDWRSLGSFFSSPGVFTEVIHVFLARDLAPAAIAPEEHEVIHIEWRALPDVIAMAHSGELRDGKSLVGIFRAAHELSANF